MNPNFPDLPKGKSMEDLLDRDNRGKIGQPTRQFSNFSEMGANDVFGMLIEMNRKIDTITEGGSVSGRTDSKAVLERRNTDHMINKANKFHSA